MKKCPFCTKDIPNDEIVCRYCKRDLNPATLPNKRTPPKKSKKKTGLYVTDEVREKWSLIKPEDYELLNAEHLRQIYDLQVRTTNAVESIKGWVVFFGVITILGMIGSLILYGC